MVCAVVVLVTAAVGIVNPPLAIALMAENSAVESLQVVLMAAAGALAARQGWVAIRMGRPAVIEVAVVTAMVMAAVSEVDLDRKIFGVKVIATLFFLNPKYPLAFRVLAVLVVVGVPTGVGVWLLTRWKTVREAGRRALREPWGQTGAFGAALYVLTQILEGPIDRIRWQQHHMIEETSELVAVLCIVIAVAARHGLGARFRRAFGIRRPAR